MYSSEINRHRMMETEMWRRLSEEQKTRVEAHIDALEEILEVGVYAKKGKMERLTRWNGDRYILPQGKTEDGESYWRIIADRLAEYENTGLTPEEIMEMKRREDV